MSEWENYAGETTFDGDPRGLSEKKPRRPCTEAATCKSCGALIFWAKTFKKKNMPVDAQPSPDGGFVLTVTGVSPDRYLSVEKYYPPKHDAAPNREARKRYVVHWETCPSAKEHKKK